MFPFDDIVMHLFKHNQCLINSLAAGRCGNNFKSIIFKLIFQIDILNNSYRIALRRMPQNPFDDKSVLVQVMAWCHQTTSHHLKQSWPRSLSPYGITRPWWVNANDTYNEKLLSDAESVQSPSNSKCKDYRGTILKKLMWYNMKRKWRYYMGQVTKVRLSCYLVLLSNDSKTR